MVSGPRIQILRRQLRRLQGFGQLDARFKRGDNLASNMGPHLHNLVRWHGKAIGPDHVVFWPPAKFGSDNKLARLSRDRPGQKVAGTQDFTGPGEIKLLTAKVK